MVSLIQSTWLSYMHVLVIRAVCEYSSPLLSARDLFQVPHRMPETADSTKPYIYQTLNIPCFFLYIHIYIHVVKFNYKSGTVEINNNNKTEKLQYAVIKVR